MRITLASFVSTPFGMRTIRPACRRLSASSISAMRPRRSVSISTCFPDGKSIQDVRHRTLSVPKREFEPPIPDDPSPTNKGKDQPGEATAKFDLTEIAENADITLHVRLNKNKDVFAADDEAWLVLGIVRKARILIVTDGNPLLQYFFESRSTQQVADVVFIKPSQLKESKSYIEPARDGKYDLVIFDRCGPQSMDDMPRSNTMFIGYPPPPWHIGGEDDGLSRANCPVSADPRLGRHRSRDAWLTRLVRVGDRGGLSLYNLPPKTPKLVEGDRGLLLIFPLSRQAYKDLVVAFPLSTNDAKWNTRWFLKPLFPLFLRNVLYTLGNVRDSTTEETVRPGMPKTIRPFGDIKEIRVRTPSGSTKKLERGTRAAFSFGGTSELGVYEVTWDDENRKFAVNLFDTNESQIEPRPAVKIGEVQIEAGPSRKQPRELWRWVVLAVLAFLLLEWWVYNRRVHV